MIFQKLTASESASRWALPPSPPADIGADATTLRTLEEQATATMKAWQAVQ